MQITISNIIDNILAQSALAAIINDLKARSLLTNDHKTVLAAIIRQEFAALVIEIRPYLDNVDFGTTDSDTLSLTFAATAIEDDTSMSRQIEQILTYAAIANAIRADDVDLADNFKSLADTATNVLMLRLGSLDLPRSLAERRC